MRFLALLLIMVAALSFPANGQDLAANFLLVDKSIGNLGTTSIKVLESNKARKFLMIHNPSATVTVACNLGGSGAAAVNGQNSINLLPYSTLTLESAVVMKNAINCIASTGSNNKLMIWEG